MAPLVLDSLLLCWLRLARLFFYLTKLIDLLTRIGTGVILGLVVGLGLGLLSRRPGLQLSLRLYGWGELSESRSGEKQNCENHENLFQ